MAQQLNLPLTTSNSFESEDFFVTDSNREAYALVESWPNWPHFCTIIYGPQGSGKTHLGQLFVAKSGETLLDDMTFSQGLSKDQEESLFHLYNKLKSEGKSLLILTDTAPSSWNITLPDLSSRLRGSSIIQLHAPDDELLTNVYAKLFADQQLRVPPQVISYLLKTHERSFNMAHRLVEKLTEASLSQKRKITVPFIKELFL